MTAEFVSHFRGYKDETLKGTWHFSQTLRLVNRDLSAVAVPQEQTVAVVVGLAIQSNMAGAIHTSQMHLDGLQRIIALRPGGLVMLRESNLGLMQKICRTDNEFALLEGTPTRYGPVLAALNPTILAPLYRDCETPVLYHPLAQMSLPLQYITLDVLAFCCAVDQRKLESYQYQDIIISICQRLLDFAPLSGLRPIDPLEDVWQLGLITFMTTILYHQKRLRFIYNGPLPRLLRSRLSNDCFLQMDGHQSLLFWLLYISGFSVFEGSGEYWLIPKVQKLIQKLKIKTWEDAKMQLGIFPWIGAAHDAPGRMFWERAMPSIAANT
jgi:hypothetical protein